MEPILVSREWLYSQLLVLLGQMLLGQTPVTRIRPAGGHPHGFLGAFTGQSATVLSNFWRGHFHRCGFKPLK